MILANTRSSGRVVKPDGTFMMLHSLAAARAAQVPPATRPGRCS
jgi:hypothetical protein